MKKILIIRFSSIGDIVLTTPVIRCLKLQQPDTEIHYLTKKTFKGILETNPYITKIYSFEKEVMEVIEELKKCNIEWVNEADRNTPVAKVSFGKRGDKYEVVMNVTSGSNMLKVRNEKFIFKQTEGVGKEIALRLFGKSGAMVWEERG